MDANWAAIIVSIVTGGFGLIGIFITHKAAKSKARKMRPSEMDLMTSTEGTQGIPRLDYLANMRHDIKADLDNLKSHHQDIKSGLYDIRQDLREGFFELRQKIDRLEDKD